MNKIENGRYMIKKQVLDYIAKTFGPRTRGSLGYRVSFMIIYIPEYSKDGHVKVEHLKTTFKNVGMSEMDFREMECEVTTHVVC